METIIAVAIVAPVVVLGLLALGMAMCVWESWWFYPMWAQIMVPLGLPSVTFWMFAALNLFVSAILTPTPQNDYVKDKENASTNTVSRFVFSFVRPVIAYYFIQWMLR